MKKRALGAALLAAALAAGTLAGCGGGAKETTAASSAETAAETTAAEANAEETTAEAAAETTAAELKPIVVGASPAPHAQILEAAKTVMAAKGYDLQIQEYTDYVIPNQALDGGDLDANYFQHKPYLDSFNEISF